MIVGSAVDTIVASRAVNRPVKASARMIDQNAIDFLGEGRGEVTVESGAPSFTTALSILPLLFSTFSCPYILNCASSCVLGLVVLPIVATRFEPDLRSKM